MQRGIKTSITHKTLCKTAAVDKNILNKSHTVVKQGMNFTVAVGVAMNLATQL
jgi:hypothetical protein